MAEPDGTNPDAPAHEEPPVEVSLRDQRVAVIVDLKLRLRFNRKAVRRLVDEWGVGESYIYELATDANKVVRRQAVDPDSVAAELIPDLMQTFRATGRSVRDKGGDPHAQAKMAASYASIGTLLADISGLKAAKKTELTGAEGGPVQVTGPTIFIPVESDD